MKKIPVISAVLFVALLLALLWLVVYNMQFVLSSLPIEFREGHSMAPTTLLLNGIRPFTLDTYPEYYNSYGFLYSVVVLPFVWLFGNNLPVYRIVNELFWVATIAIIILYRSNTRNKNGWVIKLIVATNLFLFFHIGTNVSIRPDGLGTFLFSAAVLIPLRRQFNNRSLIVSGALSILAFFTKSYFLLGWYAVSAALLLHNWKSFLKYNIYFHIGLLLSCIAVNRVFPLYFYETVFSYNGDNSIGTLSYSISQFLRSIKILSPVIVLCLVSALSFWKSDRTGHCAVLEYGLVAFIVALSLIYPLGTNDGAYLTYHSQLLAPVLAIIAVDFCRDSFIGEWALFQIVVCLFFVFSFYKMQFLHTAKDSYDDWCRAERYITEGEVILNNPLSSALLQEYNKPIVDGGVSEFAYEFSPGKITGFLWGRDLEIIKRREEWIATLKGKIESGAFDCVILSVGDRYYELCLDSGYEVIDSLVLDLPCNGPVSLKVMKYSEL